MGSLSSKRQYYHYPYTAQPVSTPYPYQVQGQGQFGYYIQQVGRESSQVQAIPGYYYYPDAQRVRSRTSQKRHNSTPLLSSSPPLQPQLPSKESTGTSSEETAAPTSAPAPESATEPSAAPAAPDGSASETKEDPAEGPAKDSTDAKAANDPASQPAAPSISEPEPQILKNPPPHFPIDAQHVTYRRSRRTPKRSSPDVAGYYAVPIASVAYKPHLRQQYRSPPKAKDPILRLPRPHEELKREAEMLNSTNRGPLTRLRSLTMPSLSGITSKKTSRLPVTTQSISYPYPYASAPGSRGAIPSFLPVSTAPVPSGPPIVVSLNSPLNPTSLHKILYKKKLYPTAAHLFEAHKFLKHKPELAEQIRTSSEMAAEMDLISRAFERDGFVRSDWALVWRDKMDDVLYLKFVQHPDIRAELMATGYAPLLDGNEPRRPDAEGVNELGKALVRLRERLRREGAR